MGLNSPSGLAEKLPTGVDKTTARHDFIDSTYTPHSARGSEHLGHWWLQKKSKTGPNKNCVGHEGRPEKWNAPFRAAIHWLPGLKEWTSLVPAPGPLGRFCVLNVNKQVCSSAKIRHSTI